MTLCEEILTPSLHKKPVYCSDGLKNRVKLEGTEEKTGAEMNVIKDVIFEGPVREQIDKSVAFLATQIKERTYLGADGHYCV